MTAKRACATALLLAAACNRPLASRDGGTVGAAGHGATGGGGLPMVNAAGTGGVASPGGTGGDIAGGGSGGAGSGGAGGATGGSGPLGNGGAGGRACGPNCVDHMFCELEPGGCYLDAPSSQCVERPTICTTDYDPVCGCDGKTYGSDCDRRAAGVSLYALGACDGTGVRCVSNDGRSRECRADLFCEIPAGACNNDAPSPGICVAGPGGCDEVYQPVCGCDQITYSNDCYRQIARVPKLANGVCVGACPPLPPVGACMNPGKVCRYGLERNPECFVQATCDPTGSWALSGTVCP